MKSQNYSTIILFSFLFCVATYIRAQSPTQQWDSIRATTIPSVATAFVNDYETPYRMPLAAYGWEDGIHLSRDGKHLYALYYPGDLLGWTIFFGQNVGSAGFCQLFGDTTYLRPYANTYGMDMTTNIYGCSNFLNIDILYSVRTSTTDTFTTWQLSDAARPGAVEGGSMPLFSENDSNQVDIFLFTGNSSIWMIRNTPANPNNISSATRLPTPINPDSNEFEADNPHLERISGDTLLLVFEQYTNGNYRDFMYAFSYDNGFNWTSPTLITTVHNGMGKIEHPHLFNDSQDDWYLFYSLDCDIYRSKQGTPGDWDSWSSPELVIGKGTSPCVGEPSLSAKGDIAFAVVNKVNNANNDSTDTYDIDPWYLPRKNTTSTGETVSIQKDISIMPNPFSTYLSIQGESMYKVEIMDLTGRIMKQSKVSKGNDVIRLNTRDMKKGFYIIRVHGNKGSYSRRVIKY